MKAKVGIYFFGRSYNIWGIWCYDSVNEETGGYSAQKIATCYSYEEALKTTYRLNGWDEPKYIRRKY